MNDRGRRNEADGLERSDAVRREFDAVADVVDGGVLRVDGDGRIVDADSAFRTLEPTAGDAAVGASLSTVFGDKAASVLRDALDDAGNDAVESPVRVETASGQRREYDADVRAVSAADGTGGIVVLREQRSDDVAAESTTRDDASSGGPDGRNDASSGHLAEEQDWVGEQATVLGELYEFATQSDAPLEERIRGILSVLREVAGTEYGTLARVEDDTYVFEVVDGVADGTVTEGDTLALSETNCERVVDQEATLVLRDIQSEAPDLAARSGNQDLGLSCYLGAPVVLDGEVYGAVCVYGSDTCEFSERAVSLVEVAAALVEYELQQERAKEELRAERELAETARRRYETLVENFPNGAVGLVDENLRYETVGGTPQTGGGQSAEELTGQHVSEALSDDLAAEIVPKYRAALEGARSDVEYETDDSVVRIRILPVRNDDGGVVGAIGMSQDVTDQKERERELSKYESLVETVDDGIYVTDEDYRFTTVNDAFAELTGYSRSELLGAEASLVVDDETLAEARELREQNDAPASLETTIERADGESIPVEVTFSTLETHDGEEKRVGVVRDVSERVERRRRIEESEQRYRSLVESFPNGAVGLFNEDLEYTAVGGELVDETDIEADELVGRSVHDIYPDELAESVEPHFEAALDGETRSFDAEYRGRHLSAQTLPVRGPDGHVDSGMLVVQDVTERREYQCKLEASNERLEQFAYAASHDLQEPLRMVSSYLSLIESRYDDVLDEDGREFIQYAVNGAERMQEMIEALLQYSRVETEGKEFEPVDLEVVVEDVRQDYRLKVEETDADVTVGSLPTVSGDEDQLRQVVGNLLSNAIEYCGEDPPDVDISAHRDGDAWVVAVEDDGIGIDPEHVDRIFEVFQRLHAPDEHSGTGIGLALCERIVERHGGDIWVESDPGDGSTFYFSIPDEGQADD